MRKKVTVVGGGFVGSTTAQRIVDLELADVVLTDILDGPPGGQGAGYGGVHADHRVRTRTSPAFPRRPAITRKPPTATWSW